MSAQHASPHEPGRGVADLVHGPREGHIGDRPPVDRDPLVDPHEVGRRVTPVRSPDARRAASQYAATEPLPFVPAISSDG